MLKSFIIICLVQITYNQLIVKPNESAVTHDQFKPFVALCTGQGNIRVDRWRSPSQIDISENDHSRITVERKIYGLRLRIRNLTRNDQGTWQCLGYDLNGSPFSSNLQLNVKVPITFISTRIQYAALNSNVLIKCHVIASPSAEISWFKGEDKHNLFSENYQQSNEGLRIERVSLMDNDTFWCQADVIETGESKDYRIQVVVAQAITSTKITCLSPCAVEKRTATLICEANGMPAPEFSWFYGQNSPLTVNGISKFVVRGNRLMINDVDETDNGRYSCHAFNDYDQKGQRVDHLLNVIIPPYILPIPSVEIRLDEYFLSQRVTFSCRVQRGSTESLSLQWLYANNTPIQSTSDISIDNTQLTSHRLSELIFDPVRHEHYGNYTCVAKNLADISSATAQFIIQYKPRIIEPTITDVYGVPNRYVMMQCQFDSYPPPVIRWIKITRNNNQMILEENDPRRISLLTDLIGPTIYETKLTYNPADEDFESRFQCQADNSQIEKHSIILRRAELPRQVRVPSIKTSANTIELNVHPTVEMNSLPLLRYIVKYEQINIPNSTHTLSYPVQSNDSPQSILLTSLQSSTSYRIEVAVESEAGRSVFSTPIQAKTTNGEIPEFTLSNVECLNETSCLIRWFIPNDGRSPVSKVEISYAKIARNGKTGQWSKPIVIEPPTTEYQLKGLKPKKNYEIAVRLFNAAGFSEQKTRGFTMAKRDESANLLLIVVIIVSVIVLTIAIFVLSIVGRFFCHRNL